jgi:transcriptional regulator with XRE-family HTH domain
MTAVKKPRTIPPNIVREIRLELGLTQKEFARALGVVKTSITNWEQKGVPETGPIPGWFEQIYEEIKLNPGVWIRGQFYEKKKTQFDKMGRVYRERPNWHKNKERSDGTDV